MSKSWSNSSPLLPSENDTWPLAPSSAALKSLSLSNTTESGLVWGFLSQATRILLLCFAGTTTCSVPILIILWPTWYDVPVSPCINSTGSKPFLGLFCALKVLPFIVTPSSPNSIFFAPDTCIAPNGWPNACLADISDIYIVTVDLSFNPGPLPVLGTFVLLVVVPSTTYVLPSSVVNSTRPPFFGAVVDGPEIASYNSPRVSALRLCLSIYSLAVIIWPLSEPLAVPMASIIIVSDGLNFWFLLSWGRELSPIL